MRVTKYPNKVSRKITWNACHEINYAKLLCQTAAKQRIGGKFHLYTQSTYTQKDMQEQKKIEPFMLLAYNNKYKKLWLIY